MLYIGKKTEAISENHKTRINILGQKTELLILQQVFRTVNTVF
jgi:hypothetical protein